MYRRRALWALPPSHKNTVVGHLTYPCSLICRDEDPAHRVHDVYIAMEYESPDHVVNARASSNIEPK
jgi:hypothetical protein